MKLHVETSTKKIVLDMEGALILTPQDPKRGAEYTEEFSRFMNELGISFLMINADIAQRPPVKINSPFNNFKNGK